MAQHKLVIAEKPSVAQSLAAVIGATVRKDGYLEGNGWRVSWCVGHLAGLADADSYDPKYAKWRYDDLPILPEHWQMVVGKDKKKQFDILKKLMNAPDVTEVVNACDAGREGEMIFRSVYELADCQKPMKRLWISSMEDSAIREGFANLRPGADYDGLRDAALCRAKADWLVGINATRLFSVLYHRTLNIGRVMSPTLALIVQREAEIDTFQPIPFYTVALELVLLIWCVKNSSAAVPREKNWNRPVPQYGISSNRSCPPISLPPRKNGSRSDNHGKAQAGCSGFVLGVRRRTGTDPSKDAAIRDREFERLSAENGAGWVCGQAGTAGAEGVGLPDAPKQQQLESADPQSA